MNTHTKKLFDRALDQAVPGTWTQLSYEQMTRLSSVFAELIVQECISIVDNAERGGSNDIWDNAVKFIKRDLQEHFGVEE
jgi:hypothetical protein